MSTFHFDIQMRATSHRGRWRDLKQQICYACEAPLIIDQPDTTNPHRLLGHCSCEECGIWFAIIIRPDNELTYLVRLPSVVELAEAIARQEAVHRRPLGSGD